MQYFTKSITANKIPQNETAILKTKVGIVFYHFLFGLQSNCERLGPLLSI